MELSRSINRCMASSFFPSPNGYKAHHFSPLPTLTHSLLQDFSLFSLLSLQASNVAEKIPHREQTHERKSRTRTRVSLLSSLRSAELVSDEKKVEHRGRKQRHDSRNGGSRGYREMGLSGFSSTRSKDGGADGKSKKFEDNSMVVEKKSKKFKVSSPEFELRVRLDMCSKAGDVMGAISLYDSALKEGIELGQYHYNVLLYLCSSAAIGVIHPAKSGSGSTSSNSDSEKEDLNDGCLEMHSGNLARLRKLGNRLNSKLQLSGGRESNSRNETGESDEKNDSSIPIQVSDHIRDYARRRGFEIYEKMCSEKIPMSEAALTSVARMAMSMGNGDMAFEIVKNMKALGITPRLRSYGPAILSFCNNGNVEKAFEVERHMLESGVHPEEPELEALLRASVRARRSEKVYYLLHKLRTSVRQVSPSTADLIEAWFKSSTASRVGKRKWDGKMVEQAMENGGGGWHGLGWLGKGKWAVARTYVDDDGVCGVCGEKLVTIDLDPIETENFARSVAAIASKRERNLSFQKFQRWLGYYGPFEAVVDAANVGLFSQRLFSLTKVNAVVNAIRQKLPSKKWPLIIVHNKRLIGRKMDGPLNGKLIEKWKNADAIYATPTGSNDDWYWLYAAIKCKCLIVTNDEMRDHVFQILGNDFFPKWKERHQVRFSFRDGSFEFHMPPPCSVVIQELEKGHWHIPILAEHDSRREKIWLCVTRAISQKRMQDSPISHKEAHPGKVTKKDASDAQASNPVRFLFEDAYRQQYHSSNEHSHERINRSPQRNIANTEVPKSHTIVSDIEAAEKLSGCVIDFQI